MFSMLIFFMLCYVMSCQCYAVMLCHVSVILCLLCCVILCYGLRAFCVGGLNTVLNPCGMKQDYLKQYSCFIAHRCFAVFRIGGFTIRSSHGSSTVAAFLFSPDGP